MDELEEVKKGRRFSMVLADKHVRVNKYERKNAVADLGIRILNVGGGGEEGQFSHLKVADVNEDRESDTLREMTALTRKVARDEHKLDVEIKENLRRSEEKLGSGTGLGWLGLGPRARVWVRVCGLGLALKG